MVKYENINKLDLRKIEDFCINICWEIIVNKYRSYLSVDEY